MGEKKTIVEVRTNACTPPSVRATLPKVQQVWVIACRSEKAGIEGRIFSLRARGGELRKGEIWEKGLEPLCTDLYRENLER